MVFPEKNLRCLGGIRLESNRWSVDDAHAARALWMEDISAQLSNDADLDAQIESLLTQAEGEKQELNAALSDLPTPVTDASIGSEASGVEMMTSAQLDEVLVSDLLADASNEIELANPGPLTPPPVVDPLAELSPDTADEGANELVAAAMADHAALNHAEADGPASEASVIAAGAEHASPELEAVLSDLEATPPELSDVVVGLPAATSAEPASVANESTPLVTSVAADDPIGEAMSAIAAEAIGSSELAASAAASPAVSVASAPGVPNAASKPAAAEPPPAGAKVHDDFEFVSPEALVSTASASVPGPAPSVRELDDHLAQAAPKAVEAAIQAAAAQAATTSHTESVHSAGAAPPSRSAEASKAATVPVAHGSVGGAPAIPAGERISGAAHEATSAEPAKPGVISRAATAVLAAPMAALAKLHVKLGESTRQTIGYVALMTAFFAITTWAYLLLKQPPKLEAVSGVRTLLKPGDPAPAMESHGSEHASESPSAKAPSGGHGEGGGEGGGHGEPAKKDAHGAAKAPPKKSSKKEPAKKDAAKADAHGKKDAAKKGAHETAAAEH